MLCAKRIFTFKVDFSYLSRPQLLLVKRARRVQAGRPVLLRELILPRSQPTSAGRDQPVAPARAARPWPATRATHAACRSVP